MLTSTAATGQLGRLVLADLLPRGVPADEIVAAVRDPGKAADLAALWVRVRLPQAGDAGQGARRHREPLFISGSEAGLPGARA